MFLNDNWDTATFVTNYLPLALFPIMYVTARYIIYRTPTVKAHEMDFISGIAEIEAISSDEEPPRNAVEKFWKWLM